MEILILLIILIIMARAKSSRGHFTNTPPKTTPTIRPNGPIRLNPFAKKKTYIISESGVKLDFMPKIKCLVCGRTSYHPEDVKNLYCGYCNKFHKKVEGDTYE